MSSSGGKQLECRVVIRHRPDGRVDLGMYDPLSGRYEPLGTHPASTAGMDSAARQREVERAVRGLAESITRAGHLLTFSEITERATVQGYR